MVLIRTMQYMEKESILLTQAEFLGQQLIFKLLEIQLQTLLKIWLQNKKQELLMKD
ncbi:hypothetical protein D3C75_1189740 [compost metagenome]